MSASNAAESSGMPKLINPQQTGSMYPETPKAEKPKHVTTPRTLLERIPIAGLYNFLESRSKMESRFWICVLVIASAITMYYLIPCIREYLKFTKVIEVTHMTENAAAFPPVQISVNSLNKTYFFNEARKLMPIFEKDPRIQVLAERMNLTIWNLIDWSISYMTLPPYHEQGFKEDWQVIIMNEVLYRGHLAFGNDWKGISTAYNESRFHCGEVLKKCTYQGNEFPCCPAHNHTGWGSMVSTVYKIDIPATTKSASSPLVVQTAIEVVNLLPHLLEEAGIWVHFGHHLGTGYDTVIPVSPGSNTLIRVKRKRRQLLGDCMQEYRYKHALHQRSHPLLQKYFRDMEKPNNYHINKCMAAVLMEELYYRCGCVTDYDTIAPNDTEICTPAHGYICVFKAYEAKNQLPQMEKIVKDVFRNVKKQISGCIELCDTWEYQFQITSLPLAENLGDTEKIISNQITIDIEPGYELVSDTIKIDALSFEASIGDAFSLFLGVSIVSFVQAAVWGIAAICLFYKQRRIVPVSDIN